MSDTLISSLYSALSADTDLADVVSDRIYPVRAPQPTDPPYVVFSRVSGETGIHMAGASNDKESRIQIDLFARRFSEIEDMSEAVIALLHAKTGLLSSTETWVIMQEGNFDTFEDEDRLFHRSLDFRVVYTV